MLENNGIARQTLSILRAGTQSRGSVPGHVPSHSRRHVQSLQVDYCQRQGAGVLCATASDSVQGYRPPLEREVERTGMMSPGQRWAWTGCNHQYSPNPA